MVQALYLFLSFLSFLDESVLFLDVPFYVRSFPQSPSDESLFVYFLKISICLSGRGNQRHLLSFFFFF